MELLPCHHQCRALTASTMTSSLFPSFIEIGQYLKGREFWGDLAKTFNGFHCLLDILLGNKMSRTVKSKSIPLTKRVIDLAKNL